MRCTAAAQGAALAVQREVNADAAEVAQAGADFVQQQLQGFGVGSLKAFWPQRHPKTQRIQKKEPPQPIERQQHKVMQAQARQRPSCSRPLQPRRHEAPEGVKHRIRLRLGPDTPQQTSVFRRAPP